MQIFQLTWPINVNFEAFEKVVEEFQALDEQVQGEAGWFLREKDCHETPRGHHTPRLLPCNNLHRHVLQELHLVS